MLERIRGLGYSPDIRSRLQAFGGSVLSAPTSGCVAVLQVSRAGRLQALGVKTCRVRVFLGPTTLALNVVLGSRPFTLKIL